MLLSLARGVYANLLGEHFLLPESLARPLPSRPTQLLRRAKAGVKPPAGCVPSGQLILNRYHHLAGGPVSLEDPNLHQILTLGLM